MAASLEELIEEWEARSCELKDREESLEEDELDQVIANSETIEELERCIFDLRDTMIVMQAEEVRRGAVPIKKEVA